MLSGLKKGVKIFRTGFIVLTVYIIVIVLFFQIIHKNRVNLSTNIVEHNREKIYSMINNPKILSTEQGRLFSRLLRYSTCSLIGEACTDNPNDTDKYFSKSIIGSATQLLLYPYLNPPASGIQWVSNELANAGFIPHIMAAEGIGFASIKPLTAIWKALRDVSYMILVLVIMTIGFMIMFRTKINPQTVVSVENALPKIVMSLIYITFSFAIAGFFIDLMYLSIALIISIIGPSDPTNSLNVAELQNKYMTAGPGLIFGSLLNHNIGNIFWTLPNSLLNLVPTIGAIIRVIGSMISIYFLFPWIFRSPLLDGLLHLDAEVKAELVVGASVSGLLKLLKNSSIAVVAAALSLLLGPILIIPLLLGLVIFLTTVMLFFRIFFMLISAYIKLFLLIILSPLYLMLEAIPGQSTFISWIKNLLNELIVFPALIAIFLIASVVTQSAQSGVLLQPPFMVGINPESYTFIIGMWILFMTPDLIMLLQKIINPKPLPLEAGIGTFFGGASSGISGGLGEIQKYALIAPKIAPLRYIFNALGIKDRPSTP